MVVVLACRARPPLTKAYLLYEALEYLQAIDVGVISPTSMLQAKYAFFLNCSTLGHKYVKKTNMLHVNSQTIAVAIRHVARGDYRSLRDFTKHLGMLKSALPIMQRNRGDFSRLAPNYQHAMVFKLQEDSELVNYVIPCSKMFYCLTSETTQYL
ncbi:hypothetical protein PoB_000485700 [Plakobranchus ocellatus]|uniref:Uncharacterized protein n=1 Tax=Plakobranchus ocellatus TaxID=259542 RepID=A0AAV3Y8A3_9GAST|nr:hypothetical protein PoB_000485700 [Plakobranchus ocellatus]